MYICLLLVNLIIRCSSDNCKGESTLSDEPIWQEEATIKVPQPTLTYCEDKCHMLEMTGTMIKSGNVCKCSYKPEKTNYNKCMSYCLDDERLEGADRDLCKYIDDICYTYKYIKVAV